MDDSATALRMLIAATSEFLFLLKKTDLPEIHVWALALATGIVTVLALRPGTSSRAVRRAFVTSAIIGLAGLGLLALLQFKAYQALTEEEHLIEWLTAHFLMASSVVALVAAIRLSRQGRPSPFAALLSAGFFFGCARETEWGEPFLGHKAWYSRNLFRWEAYVDPTYHQRFSESLKRPFATTYATHLIFSAVFILIVLVVGIYILRHRRTFAAELRALPRLDCGWLLASGAAIYLGSQGLGRLFEELLVSRYLVDWRAAKHVSHRIVDEPLELLAAACFLVAAIFLFKRRLQAAPPQGVNPPAETSTGKD